MKLPSYQVGPEDGKTAEHVATFDDTPTIKGKDPDFGQGLQAAKKAAKPGDFSESSISGYDGSFAGGVAR